MSLDRNDPRLTAYALAELSEADREALESEIAGDDTILAEIESIRDTAKLLTEELGAGAPPSLGVDRHAAIEQAAREREQSDSDDPGSATPIRSGLLRRRAGLIAGAATFLAAAASAVLFVNTAHRDNATPAVVDAKGVAKGRGELAAAEPPPAAPSSMTFALVPEAADTQTKRRGAEYDTETYDHFTDNAFVLVAQDPRSTFSIDVDTAAYSLVRRHLRDGRLPPPGVVRIEEMVNYFHYEYPEPASDVPFSVNAEVSQAPWAPSHELVRIGIKGKHVPAATRPRANLVFLLDVSGSMESADKLPLLKRGFAMLANQLDEGDHVSVVVYAGASGLVLPPTSGDRKREILDALGRLEAGGSTNGGEGIQLAYRQARANFTPGGINRVILATDGDFNVGTTNQSELVRLVQKEAKSGVFLTVLGFGSGNYKDSMLEKLADHGNGNYAYIDGAAEARKVLVEQATGTLITIAKDVKIQLEMNPRRVEAFRLIGYENRVLAHQDFTDDSKDAGEIGADHTVTALYEIVPKGERVPGAEQRTLLRYQQPSQPTAAAQSSELLTVKLRYKKPDGKKSRLIEHPIIDRAKSLAKTSTDFRFATAVAELGLLLSDSKHKGAATYDALIRRARGAIGSDNGGYRRAFVKLALEAKRLGASHTIAH